MENKNNFGNYKTQQILRVEIGGGLEGLWRGATIAFNSAPIPGLPGISVWASMDHRNGSSATAQRIYDYIHQKARSQGALYRLESNVPCDLEKFVEARSLKPPQ